MPLVTFVGIKIIAGYYFTRLLLSLSLIRVYHVFMHMCTHTCRIESLAFQDSIGWGCVHMQSGLALAHRTPKEE